MEPIKDKTAELLFDFLKENLPHGSGIDAAYSIGFKGNTAIAKNSFHKMDENGFYCGWQDFSVYIDCENMEIKVTGAREDLREYLGDTFRYWLSDNKKKIADIVGISLVPKASSAAIRDSIGSWRSSMIEVYGAYPAWPEWAKMVSFMVNETSIKIENLTDFKG